MPLAKVLDSALPNAVHRFLTKAKEQNKSAFHRRRWVEPVGGEVEVIEYILAETGIDWGRMKGVEMVADGSKVSIIDAYTDENGLGLGGWSRSQEWPEEVADAVIRLLEPAYGEKGRTRAYWLSGAKELVAEPAKSPCPECGGSKDMVSPMTGAFTKEGPFISPVTGREYYKWFYPDLLTWCAGALLSARQTWFWPLTPLLAVIR